MLEKTENKRQSCEIVNIDELIPSDHLLRKIEKSIDFTELYAFVEDKYSKTMGRPSVDPVILIKILMLQHLYGIKSLRRTVEEINVNVAYRWFLGYGLMDRIPHFSTVSYNFLHRYDEETVEQIFNWVLNKAVRKKFVKTDEVFIDATHIKANANKKKYDKVDIPATARAYTQQLYKDVNADREENGKKPLKESTSDEQDTHQVLISKTDPESGLFHKGEHEKCFAYAAHTACDKRNFILGVEVRPGNIHDSIVFDDIYHTVTSRFPEIKAVAVDAGYKTPWISKQILDDDRIPVMPYKRPMGKAGFYRPYEYVYDEYYNCVICPENKVLKYSTTDRDGYRIFKSNPEDCKHCPNRDKCTTAKNNQKIVTKHIWGDYLETVEDIRHSAYGKEIYALRSQTIERVFGDAKEKHEMRYTRLRGLAQVTKWVKLKFACMNLKKLAVWMWGGTHTFLLYRHFYVNCWRFA
jgi:transposase